MKILFAGCLVAGMLLSLSTQAADVDARLQRSIESLDLDAEVDVIIRFKRHVNVKSFRSKNRSLRRRSLLRRLKTVANVDQKPIRKLLRSLRVKKQRQLWLINGLSARVPVWMVEALASMVNVDSITEDFKLAMPVTPLAAPAATPAWNLAAVQADQVWQQGYLGQNTVVAIMDTGVDPNHNALAGSWRGGTQSWFDPHGEHPSIPFDGDGHGTQVAGIIAGGEIAGTSIGMAPSTQWIGVKIFSDAGFAPLSVIHAGFQWILDPDGNPSTTSDVPDIVSNSWGFPTMFNQCDGEFSDDIAVLRQADVSVVFAGGNSGPDTATDLPPGNLPGSLSVGSLNPDLTVSSFSSRGPSACNGGIFPHLTAPGVNIFTSNVSFGGTFPDSSISVNGTSFAAPHVSGALALLKSAVPNATESQLEAALIDSVADLGAIGADHDYGYGVLQVADALTWLETNVATTSPGELQFDVQSYEVREDTGIASAVVDVNRSSGASGEVSVDYTTVDGSAVATSDFMPVSGTLVFKHGVVRQSISIPLVDDDVVEPDENFSILLSNATAGAAIGFQDIAVVSIVDDLTDADIDGFHAGVDCNDNDPTIYPGAPEIKHDGIDQDCNGLDLTIEIERADYFSGSDFLLIWASSTLAQNADLTVRIDLQDGGKIFRNMKWRADKGRWQRAVGNVAAVFGSTPVSINVVGVEGVETSLVNGL